MAQRLSEAISGHFAEFVASDSSISYAKSASAGAISADYRYGRRNESYEQGEAG